MTTIAQMMLSEEALNEYIKSYPDYWMEPAEIPDDAYSLYADLGIDVRDRNLVFDLQYDEEAQKRMLLDGRYDFLFEKLEETGFVQPQPGCQYKAGERIMTVRDFDAVAMFEAALEHCRCCVALEFGSCIADDGLLVLTEDDGTRHVYDYGVCGWFFRDEPWTREYGKVDKWSDDGRPIGRVACPYFDWS